jgi:hypothetical protein
MQFIRTHLATIIAGIAIVAILAGSFMVVGNLGTQGAPHGGLVVIVHDGEGGERTAPLDTNNTLEFQTSLGHNVITIANGTARMTEADCPHGNCTQQQPISQPGQQIICLPHKLWVEIVAQGSSGGELDATAVSYGDNGGAPSADSIDLVAR